MVHVIPRRRTDEDGAALVLAIAFMIVVGAIVAVLLGNITTTLNDRKVLDGARNREYAADAAIEKAIGAVRDIGGAGPALAAQPADCEPSPGPHSYTFTTSGTTIRVNCTNVPTSTFKGFLQRNVVFTACVAVGSTDCGQPTTPVIIRAQVNYQAVGSGPTLNVTGTYIQSWSVNA